MRLHNKHLFADVNAPTIESSLYFALCLLARQVPAQTHHACDGMIPGAFLPGIANLPANTLPSAAYKQVTLFLRLRFRVPAHVVVMM